MNTERAAYLEALLEDGDTKVITLGIRALAETTGGMASLAEQAGLSRETLYRTLSAAGNPRLDTLIALLRAMGLRLSVVPLDKRRHPLKAAVGVDGDALALDLIPAKGAGKLQGDKARSLARKAFRGQRSA